MGHNVKKPIGTITRCFAKKNKNGSSLVAGGAIIGCFAAPVGLSLLGFSALGPVAGSVASMGVGGAGGGAAWGFATLQSIAMTAGLSAKIGAASGAVVGVVKSLV